MSEHNGDGNDWGSSSGSGQDEHIELDRPQNEPPGGGGRPSHQGHAAGGSHQPPGHSPGGGFSDHGGGFYRQASFDDITRTASLLLKRIVGAPLIAWAILGAIDLVFVLGIFAMMFALFGGAVAAMDGNFGTMGAALAGAGLIFIVQIVLSLIVQSLRIALYGPMRDLVTGGGNPAFSDMMRQMFSRVVPIIGTNFLVALAVLAGAVACIIPGIVIAFLLCMAPYYTAQGESPIDAIKHSYETTKANVGLFIAGFIALFLLALMIAGANQVTAEMAVQMFGESGAIVSMIGQWAVQFIFGFFLWIVGASFFIAVDTAESGERVA